MYDVEKQSEAVRENGSYRTVWNQCCLSPWVRQTQKSSESEIVMVNSSEMNAGLRPAPGLWPALIFLEFNMTISDSLDF